MNKKKVFCKECKYWGWGYRQMVICIHPNNMEDTFYEEKSNPILPAKDKNANNNCKDYLNAELDKAKEQLYEK